MSSDGATVNPHAISELPECPGLDGRRGRHNPIWLHVGGCVTDKTVCSNCGEIRENSLNSNRVIQPGVEHVDPIQPRE